MRMDNLESTSPRKLPYSTRGAAVLTNIVPAVEIEHLHIETQRPEVIDLVTNKRAKPGLGLRRIHVRHNQDVQWASTSSLSAGKGPPSRRLAIPRARSVGPKKAALSLSCVAPSRCRVAAAVEDFAENLRIPLDHRFQRVALLIDGIRGLSHRVARDRIPR